MLISIQLQQPEFKVQYYVFLGTFAGDRTTYSSQLYNLNALLYLLVVVWQKLKTSTSGQIIWSISFRSEDILSCRYLILQHLWNKRGIGQYLKYLSEISSPYAMFLVNGTQKDAKRDQASASTLCWVDETRSYSQGAAKLSRFWSYPSTWRPPSIFFLAACMLAKFMSCKAEYLKYAMWGGDYSVRWNGVYWRW